MEIAKRVRQFKWTKKARPQTWQEELLFFNNDDYFNDLLDGVNHAQHTVLFETYIFERGHLADCLTRALSAAVARGVTVQLLVDGVGSPAFWRDYGHTLSAQGVQVRLFRAWPWHFRHRRLTWWKAAEEFLRRWRRLNNGNHRKTCLIDGQVAWISSCNVSDVHLPSRVGSRAWIDTGMRVRGPELKRLERSFVVAFHHQLWQSPFQPLGSLLFLNSSILLRRSMKHEQLRRLRHAKEKVWLQTPYFVPVRPFYRRLRRLAKKGVDVRLMVPATSDVPLIRLLSYAFFRKLLLAGVRVFEFQPSFMHQKISQIDDWASVGSSNLNHRSFFHDLEVDVVVSQARNRELLRQKFLREQEQSRQLQLTDLTRLKWYEHWLGRFLFLLKYWS
ncbi:MAG: phosphatidylserine/phosphatidylglycerophosphate/cardiolipin synthase family protein [Bdellovibrionales bacterium]